MANQLTSNAEALRLFFTEDIYLIPQQAVTVGESAVKPMKVEVVFKYLGKNQKNILILVNDDQNEVSTVEGRELLRKLVKAIDLTANDFALVNYASYKGHHYDDFKTTFGCKLVLAFGVGASDLNLPVQPQNLLVDYNGVKFIFSSNLDDLERDLPGKKTLWTSLQQLK
ncbi:hypothetical protein [Pedobacter insulae]|uniref:Uncharacterized protein n=1 Tax=Pedobacter insulae TaxID=414048 RepID=A0A1I2ZRZ9_9SPHI|nr:hypothetical protein [Pedobacter insulae]SFH40588.1 hypothetical protein SAMN04489864_11153 [Pedobacter insulae]